MALQHLRTSTANKRPTPAAMADGQLAVNTAGASPGLFFKDASGNLIKVGPVHVGTTAPNASPAAGGETGNTVGEQWLDTSSSRYVFKIWDGTAWRSEAGEFVDVSGDVMTGALGIIAGTAGAPGLYVSGDTNTGVFSPGADSLALATGGTSRMVVDSSGRVGIGTTPVFDLDVAPAASSATFRIHARSNTTPVPAIELMRGTNTTFGADSYGDYRIKNDAGNLSFEYGDSGVTVERARVDSSGRVGIGTTTVDSLFHVNESANASLDALFVARGGNGLSSEARFLTKSSGGTNTGGAVGFDASAGLCLTASATSIDSAKNVVIDSSGRLLVGAATVTDPGATFESSVTSGSNFSYTSSGSLGNGQQSFTAAVGVANSNSRQCRIGVYKHSGITNACGYIFMDEEDGGDAYLWTDNSGNFRISSTITHIGTTSGTVVGTQTSDERLKNILGPVEYGLETLKQIDPVRYSLKSEPEIEKLGFIAQQVQPLIPQSIFDTNEHIEGEPEDAPTKLGMEYVALIPVLVNAIKELSAEVDALKAQLA